MDNPTPGGLTKKNSLFLPSVTAVRSPTAQPSASSFHLVDCIVVWFAMSVINNRVHQFSLEYLKSLRVVLNPLYHHKSVTRGREFFRVVHGPVLQATNPQCNVKMDFTKEMKPAFVEFTYVHRLSSVCVFASE